jgi:hypothetical protein
MPASDWKPKANSYVYQTRVENWDQVQNNKLKEIYPDLSKHFQPQFYNRRDEVVLTRLRLGHSRLTHSFLLKGEPPPQCIGCNAPNTIKHILLNCLEFSDIRARFYNVSDIFSLFHTVVKEKLIDYIREIGLYNQL